MSESAGGGGRGADGDRGAPRRQPRVGELPPAKFDVIYIGGIPPLRQIWADFKAVVKARRESPPPLE